MEGQGGTKNGSGSPNEKNESKQPQDEENDGCEDQGNDDNSSMDETIEIADDDLVVQILARLDGPSYRRALYHDAGTISEKFIVPRHFPWNSSARLSQKMAKTMPRDIDDLHVIARCEDELHAPFGDFQGMFGFGRYENGQSRGNYSNAAHPETLPPKPGCGIAAAARRSHDPGVLELITLTKMPPSIEAIVVAEDPRNSNPMEKWRAELVKDPAYAEALSHLPFQWGKTDECNQPAEQCFDHVGDDKLEADAEQSFESLKLTERRLKSRAGMQVARSCMRTCAVSMKVGGVSSRSTLFPPTTVVETRGRGVPENMRKVLRPMLCLASLPQSIQSGQVVSVEKVSELDKKGLASTLGSYDCRFMDSLLNPRRDGVIRAKKVEVGRTRLVWSSLIQGDEPFLPSTRKGLNFNSLITGQRVDASKCKRPTQVKVAVRLDGRIIMEEALEDRPSNTAAGVRKRKHSTRQAETDVRAVKLQVQCPESRTDEEINAALHYGLSNNLEENQEMTVIERGAGSGSVVYLEVGTQSSCSSDVDRNDIIATLLKFNQKKSLQKKPKRSVSIDAMSLQAVHSFGGRQVIRKSNSPRFASVPLEDGLLRAVCLIPGNMPGTAIHQILRDMSEEETRKRCSVCWSNEGYGEQGVLKCVKCGLVAHRNCCLHKGQLSSESHPLSPVEQSDVRNGAVPTNGKSQVDTESSWACAVCCHYKETCRNAPMPSRFIDGETRDNVVANRNANMPGPRCSLCPHRGGAMSPLESNDLTGHSSRWAHEVCRVWSGLDLSADNNEEESSVLENYPLSTVCALCGTGGMIDSKSTRIAGLTRCAARGCFVAFHPMCALLASKVGIDDSDSKAKTVRTRKTRHTEQVAEEKKSGINVDLEADKKLCKEYVLQLVQLSEPAGCSREEDSTTIIPIAFCGIHNPSREDSLYGCLPRGPAL